MQISSLLENSTLNELQHKFYEYFVDGVTTFLRDYNMLSSDGVITTKQSKWYYDTTDKILKIYLVK